MSHNHAHGGEVSDLRLWIAIVLNVGIVVAQIAGAAISGSLALAADAAHNASDAAALLITFFAKRLARRPADQRRTFGYARAETVAALINLTTLVAISLYLGYEGISRLISPQEVAGKTMLVVAIIAFIEDLLSVVALWPGIKASLNMRSAILHLAADTLTTVAVIIGAVAVMYGGPAWIDPALTLGISVFILWHSLREGLEAAKVLMDSAPDDLDLDGLIQAASRLQGVREIHHVHVWRIDEHRVALEAHVVVEFADLETMEALKGELKSMLSSRFDISHSTLEFERPGTDCASRDSSKGGPEP